MPIDQPNNVPMVPMSAWVSTVPAMTFAKHDRGQLAAVSADGEVRINWANVEATAADPESWNYLYAKLLLAARDRTDKPLAEEGTADDRPPHH